MAGLFDFLKPEAPPLLHDAEKRAFEMLLATREMFRIGVRALESESGDPARAKIRAMDREVNEAQQEVRQKVFESLALSGNQHLLQGLRLLTIVIDLERVGDYTKNLADLEAVFDGPLDFGPYREVVDQAVQGTSELFRLTESVMRSGSEQQAEAAIDRYDAIARLCDRTIHGLLADSAGQDCVDRSLLGLVLLLRYVKRVGAHLKNVCSAVVNPFHRIGFRPA